MLFLDGVGIGRADPEVNPFFAAQLPQLRKLLGGDLPHLSQKSIHSKAASVVPLNATLSVAGLPQSGTGQTTLFTGVNAARVIGKHFGPYPYSTLRPLIVEKNIFRMLSGIGKKVCYANAYPQRYFDHLAEHRNRITVMPMAWMAAGFRLNDFEALRTGKALSADITGEGWVKRGFGVVPVITPRQAGHRLVSILENHDFLLYDYYLTDHAGHDQSMKQAVGILETLDEFIGGIAEGMDRKRMLLLVTSDHGNMEDLSTKTHTRNPVPLIAVGAKKDDLALKPKNLTHMMPAILEIMS